MSERRGSGCDFGLESESELGLGLNTVSFPIKRLRVGGGEWKGWGLAGLAGLTPSDEAGRRRACEGGRAGVSCRSLCGGARA
jgi:hypothetical protein